MMPFLIAGSSKENQELKIQKIIASFDISSFDLTRITPENSIGIEVIRELKQKVNLKPFRSRQKAIILEEAEKLTLEAQNAFLKTLEEPPENTVLILTAKNTDLLLPTIISRCQIIELTSVQESLAADEFTIYNLQFTILTDGAVGERLKLASEVGKNREEATAWIKKMIIFLRDKLLEEVKRNNDNLLISKYLNILISFNKTHTLLSTTNVNPRLTLENLFLQLRASTPRVAPPTPGVGS